MKGKISAVEAAKRASARKRKNVVIESSDTPTLEMKASPVKRSKMNTISSSTLTTDFLSQGGVDTSIWPDAEDSLLPAAYKRFAALDDVHLSGQVAEYSLQV